MDFALHVHMYYERSDFVNCIYFEFCIIIVSTQKLIVVEQLYHLQLFELTKVVEFVNTSIENNNTLD